MIGPADVPVVEGQATIVYAVGSAEADNLGVLVQTIDGLHSAPAAVNTGNSGLPPPAPTPAACSSRSPWPPRWRRWLGRAGPPPLGRLSPPGRRESTVDTASTPAPSPAHGRRPPLPRRAAAALAPARRVLGRSVTLGATDRPRTDGGDGRGGRGVASPRAAGATTDRRRRRRRRRHPPRRRWRRPRSQRPSSGRSRGGSTRSPTPRWCRRWGCGSRASASTPRCAPSASTPTARWRYRPPPTSAGTASAPRPAQEGSAVLAAHVDYDGRRGRVLRAAPARARCPARRDLRRRRGAGLRGGRDGRRLPKGDLAASGVFDRTGPPRLALITCGGSFDADARSYRDNVVALRGAGAGRGGVMRS